MTDKSKARPTAGGHNGRKPAEDQGGFTDHGVAMPVSHASTAAAGVDGKGRNVVMIWLSDCRGSYALALIDAQTGECREYPTPFPLVGGSCSTFQAVLSRKGKYYTHFSSHFVEFDPASEAFTFVGETRSRRAICMTEDDNGVIYSAGHPDSELVSYDPATGRFRDHGIINPQNAMQYHGDMAADDAGWVYCAVGEALSQIVAFDPGSGKAHPLLSDAERVSGICASVLRAVDGKVYGVTNANAWPGTGWYEMHMGKARNIGKSLNVNATRHDQGVFPDGKILKSVDMWDRTFTVEDPATGAKHAVGFKYTSEGAHLTGVAVAPDNSVWGGAAFPMSFFNFQPGSSSWARRKALGQWNCVLNAGGLCYIGAYTNGYLQEWDPTGPWVNTEPGKAGCNPRVLAKCHPDIDRPHCLILHRATDTVVMGGIPGYGYTGGGLLFHERRTGENTLVKHEAILPWHSTMSLAELPDGRLLGGTTTRAGTGGEQKAVEAELYIMDMAGRKIAWHRAVFPGAQEYSQLSPGPRGLVYGLASFLVFEPQRMWEPKRFFVFDPETGEVAHQSDPCDEFGPFCYQQGQRKIVQAPDGRTFLLFKRCVAEIDPVSFKLTKAAEVTTDIFSGGDMLGDRIYFSNGSHLCSCRISSGRHEVTERIPS